MGKFCRIIELENDEQVLLTVEYDNKTEEYELIMKTNIDGASVELAVGFKEEEDALNGMEGYEEEHAIAFREDIIKLSS